MIFSLVPSRSGNLPGFGRRLLLLCLSGLLPALLPALNIQHGYVPDFIDPLPAELRVTPQPRTTSRSAILLEARTGTIIYAKDIDEPIPPASLTKLVVMALALEHLKKTATGLDSPVSISERAWARKAPVRSSLMFLGPNQDVTWQDLLLGLAVDSGNDAAIAVAENVDGSVPAFVEHMNRYCAGLGLARTSFVEPSGYDEHSMTTVRDFAYFVRYYVNRFPEAIERFHSVHSFTWPRGNGQKEITQHNGNKLLTSYPGADGLKTGYIDESGYNLAFTARQEGMRLIGVILGGMSDPLRFWDSRELLDYGFRQYRLVELPLLAVRPLRVWRGESTKLGLAGGTVQAVLPASLTVGLQPRLNQLYEVEAPVAANRVLAWTEYLSPSGQRLLRFPMRPGKAVNAADPVTQVAEGAYLWMRSLFGAAWPEPGAASGPVPGAGT